MALPVMQAKQLCLEGNSYFSKNQFVAAIDAYTKAIALCPNDVSIYWNRAACHLKLKDWTRVEEDCRRVIQLDHKSVMAHCMLGLAFIKRQQYAEGARKLERALDLERGANPGSHIFQKIWLILAQAKYLKWKHESTMRSTELENLKEACKSALNEKHDLGSSPMECFKDERSTSHLKQLDALDRVFKKAAEDDTPTEVPDYLCCSISREIFRDPVITPSGFTYERAEILKHLQKVREKDPITGVPLNPSLLVPNFAIRKAVQAFLNKHGWAYNMD